MKKAEASRKAIEKRYRARVATDWACVVLAAAIPVVLGLLFMRSPLKHRLVSAYGQLAPLLFAGCAVGLAILVFVHLWRRDVLDLLFEPFRAQEPWYKVAMASFAVAGIVVLPLAFRLAGPEVFSFLVEAESGANMFDATYVGLAVLAYHVLLYFGINLFGAFADKRKYLPEWKMNPTALAALRLDPRWVQVPGRRNPLRIA